MTKPLIAIPDLHGRISDLEAALKRFPEADYRYVLLGDLIDRGDQSREVVTRVRALVESGAATLLLGNHERLAIDASKEWSGVPGDATNLWMINGGSTTLAAYRADLTALTADLDWIGQHALPWLIDGPVLYAHAQRPPAWILAPAADLTSPEARNILDVMQPHLWNRPGGVLYRLPPGVEASVHGHTPQPGGEALTLLDSANHPAHFIDLGAVFGSERFCVWVPGEQSPAYFRVP